MARKTNKTAHVLNLISKAKDEHQAMEDQMQIDSTGSDVSKDLLFMGIEPTNDKSISDKINENLEAIVDQGEAIAPNETTLPEAVNEDPPQEEDKPVQEESLVQEEQIMQETTEATQMDTGENTTLETDSYKNATKKPIEAGFSTEGIEENENKHTETTDAIHTDSEKSDNGHAETEHSGMEGFEGLTFQEATPSIVAYEAAPSDEIPQELPITTPPEPRYYYINVYECLVTERIEEFQSMFDVCTCQRCTADVIALTLTNLPAKYIVSESKRSVPLLSYYREKFKSSVTAQLSSACIVIKQNPHHK